MLPELFLSRMQSLLGAEFEEFLAAYQRPRAVGLRFNPLKCETFPALNCLLEPVPWEKNGFFYDPSARPGAHPYHEAGLYYLQEPSAMSAANLLDAQPGERVLDLCAAPGGKSTQLAAAMAGEGLLVCNEYHPARAKILSRNIERMGVANALVLNETVEHLAAYFSRFFDKILVDAPCSGEGMFRKEEAAVTDWSRDTVAHCAQRQRQILQEAAGMLRGGGRLVYSTCTFSPEENEGVISTFLRENPDFSIEKVEAPYFSQGRPDWVTPPMEALADTFRLWPHRLRGEGHFAAVLRRDGGEWQDAAHPAPGRLPKEWQEFVAETSISVPEGVPVAFGSSWFLAPPLLPELKGLRVLRPGLELGSGAKGRFVPAHALALWLKSAGTTASFSPEAILPYLRGETLAGGAKGWTLVQVRGLSIGWAKGSNGVLKNHYPKGLRRNLSVKVAEL